MNKKWERLIAIFSELVEIYTVIFQLSNQKRKVLVAAKPKELEILTQKEELCVLKVGKVEQELSMLMQQIAAGYGVTTEGLTLKKIQALAEPSVSASLGAAGEQLNGLMTNLAVVNTSNGELIQQALRFVNYNINLLTQATASTTYAPQGHNTPETRVRKLFDHKI